MSHPAVICLKRHASAALVILLFGAFSLSGQAQKMDGNSNGMSDIWEALYHATGVNPALDSDDDGVPNNLESIAGTDPFNAASFPQIPAPSVSASNATVNLPGALGKFYQLQSAETLCGTTATNWLNETSLLARTNPIVSLNAAANLPAKFFRVVITDVDSDGDGLNDWEEYQLGLNPTNATSNNQLDENGAPMSDYAFAAGKLPAQGRLTIAATTPAAVQPDAGQSATSLGQFTVTRGGFPLNSVTVNLGLGGPGTGFAVEGLDHETIFRPIQFPAGVSSQTIPLTPLANSNLVTPVVAQLRVLAGSQYTVGALSNAAVVIYPSPTPKGTGLTGQYFTNSSTTYGSTANFNPTNLFLTRVDPTIDFIWGPALSPNLSNGTYTVRWTGQVQPQYSETYIFNTRTDDGLKLWVNDQLLIDQWRSQSATDFTNSITLQGGVRYNLKLEYLQRGGSGSARLYWYSESQPKQIIPASRLYPSSPSAPAVITSSLTAYGFLGQPFSFTVTGANTPLGYTAKGLPPGLSFNSTNGLISGVPALAGYFQVTVSASNSVGSGASILDLHVFDTGSAVTREVWTNVPGAGIADIPLNTPPASIGAYGALEGITDFGDNYAERIRGYFTAPVTGNYYFWIAGGDAAELWISNDSEPVNKVRRAFTPVATGPRQWHSHPKQKSGWLALKAGQKYYLEVLHKAGAGTNDNWSAGWAQDSVGTNNTPAGVVPAHLLSRHFDLPPALIPGTLYTANMLAQGTAISSGVGSATLRVSTDGSQAVLKFSYSGLTSPFTAAHIHADVYRNKNSQGQIIFDIDDAAPEADGSYVWHIEPSGSLTPQDIIEIIKEGKAYLNVHTVNYPAGEISGHFTLAEGSQTFSPPPPPPAWVDDHSNSNAAARFLIQSTFGPSPDEIAAVQALGYEGWINNQFSLPPTYHLPTVHANPSSDPTRLYPGTLMFNTWWRHSVTAPDQLRQRVAFALSEILVVSENGPLQDNARALAHYYDILLDHSFGNFRELLEAVTLSPAMGLYLDMRRNEKGDLALGRHPNENYAREILQLFSIGLYRLWPDGTLIMNSQGDLVPTYDQDVVLGFSRVFTGWNYYQPNQPNGRLPTSWNASANYTNAMTLVPLRHELGAKLLLDNVVLPPAFGSQADSASTNFDNYGLQDLELAHDSIFHNENAGPYICRQLIQRLVTSNPSRDYLYRVVQKFNDNGSGVRGDMQAVIKAILLDHDARSSTMLSVPTFGKQREPVLRVTAIARAFPAPAPMSGTFSQNGDQTITVSTAPTAHRLNNNDDVFLTFTNVTGTPPRDQGYNNVTVNSLTSFRFNAPGLSIATYGQSGTTITVTNSGHGLSVSNWVHLTFTTGGAANGMYQVVTVPSTSSFTVTASNSATRTGNCLFPKWTGGGFVQSGTNLTMIIAGHHGLSPGDEVYINFPAGTPTPNGKYPVVSVLDNERFTIHSPVSANRTDNNPTVYPLAAPPLTRSGNVNVIFSTWNMGATDSGTTASLSQTPLNSPTVFNFFFPDYKFPGLLASAGLTTPEFQLTSDTSVALQMNFLQNALLGNTGNTNGLSSFTSGDGDIMIDLGSWITPAYTSNAGIPNLVDALNSLLCGGQLSSAARTHIINYVANTANFPYTTPTRTQMRDRARAVVHLITASPDFTIQR